MKKKKKHVFNKLSKNPKFWIPNPITIICTYISFRTGNCSVRAIPASISIQLSEGDTYLRRRKRDENTVLINTKENTEPEQTSIVGTFRHVRLRHAKELLSVEPQKFVYSGSVSVFYYLLHKKVFKKREDLILNTVFFFTLLI